MTANVQYVCACVCLYFLHDTYALFRPQTPNFHTEKLVIIPIHTLTNTNMSPNNSPTNTRIHTHAIHN